MRGDSHISRSSGRSEDAVSITLHITNYTHTVLHAILMVKRSSSMFIKGSILALLIASVYAGEIADTNPSPDNSDYNDGDKTGSYPSRRRNGGGKPTPVSGSAWGSDRVRAGAGRNRARAGRIRAKAARRRRWGRPANWVSPNRPANNDWVKPSESESWDTAPDSESWGKPAEPEWVSPSWDGDTHEPTSSPTETTTEGDYQVCDKVSYSLPVPI